MWLYNLGISLYAGGIRLAALWHGKARLWSEGRRNIFERMEAAVRPSDRIVWVHAASLGEFEQARPIIERLRAEHPEYKILLTFFSPSGYEIRKNYEGADYVFYLPADTPSNARRFLDIVHPEIAIFIKYEFWINLLSELRRRKVRSYIVSAIFRRNSVFFRPYGAMWRQALETFDTLFVQNVESKRLLSEIGFDNVVVAGDTRFDRVASARRSGAAGGDDRTLSWRRSSFRGRINVGARRGDSSAARERQSGCEVCHCAPRDGRGAYRASDA